MKKYLLLLILALLTLAPWALFSQSSTFHAKYEGEFVPDFYPPEWEVHVTWQTVVNQVQKVDRNGVTEIRYTSNYSSYWVYVNKVTGERKVGPENQNITGVFSFNPDFTEWESDRHVVYHYVNDPIFGAYHINFNLLWTYNEATGFMEVRDIQNEWIKN